MDDKENDAYYYTRGSGKSYFQLMVMIDHLYRIGKISSFAYASLFGKALMLLYGVPEDRALSLANDMYDSLQKKEKEKCEE